MFVFDAGQLVRPRWVINFSTKQHWKSNSRLKDIDDGLDDLLRTLVESGIQSVAIPPLGCGNGGLDWADVLPLIERKLDGLDIDILVFPPDGAPHPAEMTNRTSRHTVTGRRLATRVDGLMVAPWPRVFADVRTVGVRGEEAAEHLREAMHDR